MRCPNCEKEIPDRSLLCPVCKYPILYMLQGKPSITRTLYDVSGKYTISISIFTEIYRDLVDASYYDPGMWRTFGATCFLLGIFCLIVIMRAEWERGKILYEFAILWVIAVLILNIWTIIVLPGSATAKANNAFNIVLLIVIAIYSAYFYYRESK